MNLICRLGRKTVLLSVLGLGLSVVGCGQPAAPPVKPPVTPVKPEGGSGMKPNAGGGTDVPAEAPGKAPADETPAPPPEGEKKEGEAK